MSLIPYQSLFDIENFLNKMKFSSSDDYLGIFSPKVEVTEKDKEYLVSAEFPGVNKEDINVSLENGILSLEAVMDKSEKTEDEGNLFFKNGNTENFQEALMWVKKLKNPILKRYIKMGFYL